MADDMEGMSGPHQSNSTVWKRKYLTLQKRCEQIEQVFIYILLPSLYFIQVKSRESSTLRTVKDKFD